MSRQRFVSLLIAAVVAISAALYLTSRRNPPPEARGTALLPALAAEMDTVTSLSVRKGAPAASVTLHEKAGHWTVAERAEYPADVSKLRKLLLALSDAKLVEEKTSNPASFAVIGVEDPSAPGAGGAEISFTARDGKHAVIIGKPVGEGNFVRRVGENTSYSVEPSITFEAEPRYWIDSHLIDIPVAGIQSIQVKPAAGPAYTLHRAAPAAPAATAAAATAAAATAAASQTADKSAVPGAPAPAAAPSPSAAPPAPPSPFVLEGVPAGRKAADPAVLAPSPSALSGLTADDVSPAGDLDFSKASVATVTLTDGTVTTVTGATIGDKHWIQVQSSKDTGFNAKTAARAFEIAGYRFDSIFRPLDQLLVPKEPPPGAAKAATGAANSTPAASPVPPKKKKPAASPAP